MKKNIICIAICLVLSAAFIVGGIFTLNARGDKQKEAEASLQLLREEKSQITTEGLEEEAAALDQQNQQLQESIAAAESECTELDGQATQLQQEYETLQQDETTAYYMTILEELMEGMSKVEEYINGSK